MRFADKRALAALDDEHQRLLAREMRDLLGRRGTRLRDLEGIVAALDRERSKLVGAHPASPHIDEAKEALNREIVELRAGQRAMEGVCAALTGLTIAEIVDLAGEAADAAK